MSSSVTFFQKHWKTAIGVLVVVALGVTAAVTQAHWLPWAKRVLAGSSLSDGAQGGKGRNGNPAFAGDQHGDPHGAESHDDAHILELSEAAQRNIGLRTTRVELQSYEKSISVPGIVVERPGRSQLEITAPMAGVITRLHTIEGEAVTPGQLLFEIRLTHEELVTAQREFLRSAEELDVLKKEIVRLEAAGQGFVAGKTVLERKFEQQKVEAALRAQEQGLLLHGLSAEQVKSILEKRNLLQFLSVSAPQHEDVNENCSTEHSFHMHKLNVRPGQHVEAGTNLCVIADHCELFIEGTAFEQDLDRLNGAASEDADVTAVLNGDGGKKVLPGLKILYLSDQVEPASRALHFYVRLPNQVLRKTEAGGHRFIVWQFRPGQRMELQVPVEKWKDRIVLPAEAVAQEGVETYVFLPNGDHFERRPVHLEYRDEQSVVIANDGALFPQDMVVTVGAQQLQLALKNKSSGGLDPHAGHQH